MANSISIIMCVKNSAKHICDALDSLVSQNFQDFELIIVDARSTDMTLAIVAQYDFPLVRVVQQDGEGIYNAFNVGVKNSTGRYIYFLHSDDRLAGEDVLESFYKIVQNYAYDMVYGNVKYVDNRNRVIREVMSTDFDIALLNQGFMPPHTGTFAKRDLFCKFGRFVEKYKISGDYEWLVRVLKERITTKYVEKDICVMKVGGISNSSLRARLRGLVEDLEVSRTHGLVPMSVFKKKLLGFRSLSS